MEILKKILLIPILLLLAGAFLHMLFQPRRQIDALVDPKGGMAKFAIIGFILSFGALLKLLGCSI